MSEDFTTFIGLKNTVIDYQGFMFFYPGYFFVCSRDRGQEHLTGVKTMEQYFLSQIQVLCTVPNLLLILSRFLLSNSFKSSI